MILLIGIDLSTCIASYLHAFLPSADICFQNYKHFKRYLSGIPPVDLGQAQHFVRPHLDLNP